MMDKATTNGLTLPQHINVKIEAMETNFHQTLYNFRDFVAEFEQMHMQAESVKKQIIIEREKCTSKSCSGSEELKKVIESKENIIQLVASALTKLNETKNFNILTEIFKILFGESKSLDMESLNVMECKKEINSDEINIGEMSIVSPREEPSENNNMSIEEPDESTSEIEGTPTGRHSPIIRTKKLKSSPNSTFIRENNKCPLNWPTPDKKTSKVVLTYSTPTRSKGSGRLRQQRITVVRERQTSLVDLSTTLQFSKGRNSHTEDSTVKNIKQEVIENDDTIMPSPTSGPAFAPAFISLTKESPQKFKKPLSLIRKVDKGPAAECKENRPSDVTHDSMESMDLLRDFQNGLTSPKKCDVPLKKYTTADDSMSLLQMNAAPARPSPAKRPLADTTNAINVHKDSSMSIMPNGDCVVKPESLECNRVRSQILEPLYKEPTVRKKADKRELPGWSCDKCQNFYGELYKDNPEMLEKKMDDCSKHRGRSNPARAKTPPGYWEPRWEVPDDTEEFNRRNNAL